MAERTEQRLLVVAAEGSRAEVTLQERTTGSGQRGAEWQDRRRCRGWIGRNGLGKTREGDGRTPAGEWRFVYAFGLCEDPGTSFPYIRVDESFYLVDDSSSRFYNQLVSTKYTGRDWSTAEHIVESAEAYAYALAIDYNKERMPGLGSGIFLHCEEGRPTAGCIAVPEADMRALMTEIRPDCLLLCRARPQKNCYKKPLIGDIKNNY